MHPARIAELLQPFLRNALLTESQLNHISTYINLLLRWNARINLTAIRAPEEIITRHFGESLFAAQHLFPHGRVGTGDSANDLAHLALDPNVHIQEVKALACDIQPGRRPRGPALRQLVREYAQRAGITDDTGTEA